MNRFFCLLLFTIFCCPSLKGQGNFPQVYEIKADTVISEDVAGKYFQVLPDPSGKLGITQVSSAAYDSKFTHNTSVNLAINTYWLRYGFKNTLSHTVRFTIAEGTGYTWLYIPLAGNKRQMLTNGESVPWSQRSGLKRNTAFVVKLQPGQEIKLYERGVADFRLVQPSLDLTIGFDVAEIKHTYFDDGRDTFYAFGWHRDTWQALGWSTVGLLGFAALFNFLFYRIVRERVYIWFTFFLFCIWFDVFCFTGMELVFKEYPLFHWYSGGWILGAMFFAIIHFIRHFLSTPAYTPPWDKFLMVLSFITLVVSIVFGYIPPFLPYNLYLTIQVLCQVIDTGFAPLLLGTLIFYWRKKYMSSVLGMFALVPLLLAVIITDALCLYIFLAVHGRTSILIILPQISAVITLTASVWAAAIFSWILFRRFGDTQQKLARASIDNERMAKEKEIERSQLIEQQKIELEHQVETRTAELKQSLEELKLTQTQLVQKEKMASLGELTAGIAHEIQNPLNFVNNFSEVSQELIGELQVELNNGDKEEAIAISEDIKQNLEKIHHHGKRADSVVKSMLEHSRTSTGQKEPTDLNKLTDEYLRLAYHGLRAKDKSFNAELITHFEENLSSINIVPQDIGRVMLNLFNNAFYAVRQKQRTAGPGYNPTVEIITFNLPSGGWGATVIDNGTGIPVAIKDKILQPFFTTKSTGEGTGLGLSLSYDIVVKGHSGSIQIESNEGEGSEFTIHLPIVD